LNLALLWLLRLRTSVVKSVSILGPLIGLAFAAGASGQACAQSDGSVSILVYHRFDPAASGSTTVTIETFEAQLDWLDTHDVAILPMRAALDRLASSNGRSPAAAVITVDDGNRSVYTTLYPLILKRRIPVTLFVYPSAISNAAYALTWDQLREMEASGLVDVESHTYWHPNFKTERRRRTPEDYRVFVDRQLRRSRQMLETRLSKPVDMLAWPFGIADADLETAAKAAGYHYAFIYEGGAAKSGQDLFALPRVPVSNDDRADRFRSLLGASSDRKSIE